jgi:HEAT repeat protein
VLADRRSPAAVPQLILRLQDENDDVARRAVGALVAIGDRRAVRPLIEMTKKRRPEQVRPIVYALGSLGGSEAEAFLFTLESGSPDEEVGRAAHDALADLRGRKDDAQNAEALRRRPP